MKTTTLFVQACALMFLAQNTLPSTEPEMAAKRVGFPKVNVSAVDRTAAQGLTTRKSVSRPDIRVARHFSEPAARSIQRIPLGPHEAAVVITESLTNAAGQLQEKSWRYTHLSPGLNVPDSVTGGWKEAKVSLRPAPGGAVADGGWFSATFAANPHSQGAFSIIAASGERLHGHVLGLRYEDVASGKGVLLAATKDTLGCISGNGGIVYRDAFDRVSGDILYQIEAGQIEQDVVIRAGLPDPGDWGLDLETTVVQVLTEFLDAPAPQIERQSLPLSEAQANRAAMEDHALFFGSLHIGLGRAFAVGQPKQAGQENSPSGFVMKQWRVINGQTVLVECLPFTLFRDLERAAGLPAAVKTADASWGDELPLPPTTPSTLNTPMQVVEMASEQPGVLLDWFLVPTIASYTFQANQTYRVTGSVTISTYSEFQATAVIKYDRNACLTINGTVVCPSSGLCVLTAVDDQTIGEPIAGTAAMPTGTYAYKALNPYPGPINGTLRNLQIRYANEGVMAYIPSYYLYLQDVTFINCNRGVAAHYALIYGTSITFCDVPTQFYNYGYGYWVPSGITTLVGDDDLDADGLVNREELQVGTDPFNPDTNGNGLLDSEEDPDGDGLVNLAEFRLMKSPTLADNPLNLTQVPSGAALSGQVFFEIPINSQLSRMPIALWVDGVPSPDAVLDKDDSGKWGVYLETRHYLNGARSLQVVFQYRSLPAFYGQPTRVSGAPKNVQFNNQAIYNPTAARFERALLVDAILPNIPTANYEVDVYDDQGILLATASGQTTDGSVTAAWDTVDPQGNPTVSGNLAVYLYVVPPSGPPIYIGPKWYIQERAALDGRYLIAWGWDTGGSTSHATRKNNMMLDGVISIVGNPALDNEYLLSPAANVPFGNTFRVQTLADKTTLENEFKSSANKNFFWFGHGSDIHISPFTNENAAVTILADDIENWLENKAHRAMGEEHLSSIYQNKNPYRLAIIHACETYSPAFANAFGVDFETSSTFVYNVLGRTPRAFVGWSSQIKVPGVFMGIDFGDHVKYAEALMTMNSYWMAGADLHTSLIEFAAKAQANGFGTEVWDFEIAGCEDLVRLP